MLNDIRKFYYSHPSARTEQCISNMQPNCNMSAIHTNLIHELFIWIYLQIMFSLRLGFLLCKCINFHPKVIKSCLHHSQALSTQISLLKSFCLFAFPHSIFFLIWSLLWWELAQKIVTKMHCHCLPVKGSLMFICITANLQDSPIRQLISLACLQELGCIGWQQRWFIKKRLRDYCK